MNNKPIRFAAGLAISLILGGAVFYFTGGFDLFGSNNTEFDVPDKENPKLVPLFNKQLDYYVDHYRQENSPGCIPLAFERVGKFYTELKTIESHTRYGFGSSRAHNGIEVKITYNNGAVADNLYTGIRWNGRNLMGNVLLMKFEMENGKAVKAYSNGVEMEGSPEWVINDLNVLIEAAISEDIKQNRSNYFYPDKTPADFKKEWENM